MKFSLLALPLALFAATLNAIDVPNPSFEKHAGDIVEGWKLSKEKQGGVCTDTPFGKAAIYALGNGEDSHYWLSQPLPFVGNQAYRLTFWCRTPGTSSGTAVTGPVFANVDLGHPGDEWQKFSNVFVAPAKVAGDNACIRLGQWHARGRVEFDNIRLSAVQPIYYKENGIALGEGEKIHMNEYTFNAPLGSEGRNHSRPLYSTTASFNTNRWVFGQDAAVVYRHNIQGRRQLAAKLELSMHYHVGGKLVIEVSNDNQNWLTLGELDKVGGINAPLPAKLFPAENIYVRLAAQSSRAVGSKDSDPGSFQFNRYVYNATLDGEAVSFAGSTSYVEVDNRNPDLKLAVNSVGEGLPGKVNNVAVTLTNTSAKALTLEPAVNVQLDSPNAPVASRKNLPAISIAAGKTITTYLPYTVSTTGTWEVSFNLGKDASFLFYVTVPQFLDNSYGEILSQSNGTTIWTASSGWKIPVKRQLPTKKTDALAIELAANESEAVQLVVTPEAPLANLTLAASSLVGDNGLNLPADIIDILRVYYHDVQIKTDKTGVIDLWPDALPPLKAPLNLEAKRNQPFWIRVNTPKNARPGIYRGTITLKADNFMQTVPLKVTVFAFALPDTMSCETAFGFDPNVVWRYQKIKDPAQKRLVLDKYFQNYSKHHISPYNPTPLDYFSYKLNLGSDAKAHTWTGTVVRDKAEHATGKSSLHLIDKSETSVISASCSTKLAYPPKGVTVRFQYKTAKPNQTIHFTMNHYDKEGNWLSGRNRDIRITSKSTDWETYSQSFPGGPEGAVTFAITLRPAVWSEAGEKLGEAFFDDVSVIDNGTGKAFFTEDFEPVDFSKADIAFNWDNWDKAMDRAVNQYHFTTFRIHIDGLGGGTFHSRNEPKFCGYAETDPEYATLFRKYIQGIESHLREKNLLKQAFIYWFDEPDTKDYEFVMNGFRKLKTYAPDIRRMLTEQVEPELCGGPNLWCPVSNAFDPKTKPERVAAGDDFWWYVCTGPKAPYCTLFIDHPGSELRCWLWQTWKHGIHGILVWQSNYWTSNAAYPDKAQNPYLDPMGWVSGYDYKPGVKQAWGNGDGRFIYPPEAAANADATEPILDGPVDSIRWEMLRDGIDDYEYFTILKQRLDQKRATLSAEAVKRYEALLTVPEDVTRTMTEFTLDPATMETHRRKLAQAIAELK